MMYVINLTLVQYLIVFQVFSMQVTSSYATPLSTRFSCAPTFLRTHTSSRTYAAASYPKKQILCWSQSGTESEESISDFSRTINGLSDVVLLKDLAKAKRKEETMGNSVLEGDILAVFSDCQVKCFSQDLATEKWTYSPSPEKIIYATTMTAATARQTILKSRPDIILWGSVSPNDEIQTEELVLLTISSKGNLTLHSILTSSKPTLNRKLAHQLFSIHIPSLSCEALTSPPALAIHIATATLHYLADGRLTTYSLINPTPSIQSIIPLRQVVGTPAKDSRPPYSLVCVSDTMVLVSTPTDLSLYDTKYRSLQATLNFSSEQTTESTIHGLTLSVFVGEIDLAIGYAAEGVVGVQLSHPRATSKSSLKSGLLINSIFRGVGDPSGGKGNPITSVKSKPGGSKPKPTALAEFAKKLEYGECEETTILEKLKGHKNSQNIAAFEADFAEYVWVQRDPEQLRVYNEWKHSAAISVDDLANTTTMHEGDGDVPPEPPEFLTPKSKAWQKTKEANPNANYARMEAKFCWRPLSEIFLTSVFSMIFELKVDGSGLEIVFFPTNVIKYLVECGSFCPFMLRFSERQQREERYEANQCVDGITHSAPKEVGQGGLVMCLVEYDPSLNHLAWFLREIGDIEVGEVITAVQVVLERINENQQGFASNPPFDEDDETRLQRLTYEAELALERASAALEDTAILGEVLRLSMRRINIFPSEVIVRGFKARLKIDELMGLVRILRRELVVDRLGDDNEHLLDEEAIFGEQGTFEATDIELICEIMTCALDAVGVAGLILANDTVLGHNQPGINIDIDGGVEVNGSADELSNSQEGNQLLISSLHSEVTHTVSSLQESAALSGLIAELIRHAGGLKAMEARQVEGNQKKEGTSSKERATALPSKPSSKPSNRPCNANKPLVILQKPVRHKYMLSRRAQRQKSMPLGHRHFKNLKAKFLAYGVSIPTSLMRKEESREQRRIMNANMGPEAMKVEITTEKERMLPLGLPPPAVRLGLSAFQKRDAARGVGRKSARLRAEEGSKRVGTYSLDEWVV